MRQIRADLWETSVDRPFPGLTTHAYLWTGGELGNVLFYSTQTDRDFAELEALGGVAHQYLSHRDEAGPMLRSIRERFGANLHAPATELLEIGMHAHVDVPLGSRHVDRNDIEVIPTPGHSPGSTCYLVPGVNGQTYLFTGDTIMLDAEGTWVAGYIPSFSEAAPLAQSLQVLAGLHPDLVITSAFPGSSGVHVPGAQRWAGCVEQARERLALVA
ncbi:MBL fold metallo-hydrolase [Mycolicibacterium sp. 120266]|uniref:MBL fold metallo-hydrolase n=1 Tax=Mycolicibacterium sp. 120266 TaxID=3090601 RepID=UPI00299E6931|nr:MBL fold metallo-hydrolase [Mycolicibacterium sp. 120266]MDX1871380.1 MBL fold metallo-hydrolase [Mycolicibacterium sp. 120266]